MSVLEVRSWSLAEFSQNQTLWQDLLAQSHADPLFMSWYWQHGWWQLFALDNEFQLEIHACYEDQQLVGLAPLYSHTATAPKLNFLAYQQVDFIGSCYRRNLGIRAEYQSFICQADRKDVHQALWRYVLNKFASSALYIPDIDQASHCYQSLQEQLANKRYLLRIEDEQPTYSVNTDTESGFENYVQSLGKNSRLKLFNRRKLLTQMGEVTFTETHADDLAELITQLNQFHQQRWNKLCFSPKLFDFIQTLVRNSENQQVFGSTLCLDNKPVSAALNLHYGKRVYNIQLGFFENFDKKISLGTLHLGYAIEAAFEHSDIEYFDFLAGEGKNDNYKQRIAEVDSQLISLLMIGDLKLKLVYGAHDALQRLSEKLKRLKARISEAPKARS